MTKRSRQFRLVVCVAILCAAALTVIARRRPASDFDRDGFPYSGFGERVFYYANGAVKLREQIESRQVAVSRWYRPDGSLILETRWVDGTGTAIHLREDGTIQIREHFLYFKSDGITEFLARDGTVERTDIYSRGNIVSSSTRPGWLPREPAKGSRSWASQP